jgi:acetyl-CoA synthetase
MGAHEIGPIATPDVIHFAPGLPKTRSGKIMRRILRKIAEGDTSNLGDISTLADPSVVESRRGADRIADADPAQGDAGGDGGASEQADRL